MATNKTVGTQADVDAFLNGVGDVVRRADALRLRDLLADVSGEAATMWGPSIVGFGRYRYRYDSGREGEMCRIGFSPRKSEQVLYLADAFEQRADLLARLGRHRTGRSCLYIKRLADVDMTILEALARGSLAEMARRYPTG